MINPGHPRTWALRAICALVSVAVLSAACTAFATTDQDSATTRPNILVIMSDEHNASVLGCYGNTLVHTPNLDSLAKHGVCFDAAYTNSPLCVPARLAFTAGKYVSRVGAWNNNTSLPSNDYPSIPRLLNSAGYESYLCGKMHYDATRRYGFTQIGNYGNTGTMTGFGSRRAADNLTTAPGYSQRFDRFGAGEGTVINHDRKVTQGTIDFLSHRKKTDKPFFLVAGYLAPHFPLKVPEEYWAPYKGKVPMPNVPPGLIESLPLNYQHLRLGFHVENVPDDVVRKSRELYYGLTQWVDGEIGKVLSTLNSTEIGENTIVIYTADHGEDMGEHGMWFKNCMYEHGARVPLIISWPKRWQGGQRRPGACSLVDVVQTIADLGGAKPPSDWNGSSMCKLLDDPKAEWKDIAVSEYYAHLIASGFVMLRSGQYKYVYHTPADSKHPAQRELYDLKKDPGELHNLASAPDQRERISKMHAMLVKEIGEDPDKTELRCRADNAKGYGLPSPASGKPGKRGKRGQTSATETMAGDDNE